MDRKNLMPPFHDGCKCVLNPETNDFETPGGDENTCVDCMNMRGIRNHEENKLIISETATGTWHYHLRKLGDGPQYGGGVGLVSICGVKLGWDTEIPLGHFDSELKTKRLCDGHFCGDCFDVAEKKGWL